MSPVREDRESRRCSVSVASRIEVAIYNSLIKNKCIQYITKISYLADNGIYADRFVEVSRNYFCFSNSNKPGLSVPAIYISGHWLRKAGFRFYDLVRGCGRHCCNAVALEGGVIKRAGDKGARLTDEDSGVSNGKLICGFG